MNTTNVLNSPGEGARGRLPYLEDGESPRVDPARMNAFEQAVMRAAAEHGMKVHAFTVFEDRLGERVPRVTIEVEQGTAPDPVKAAIWLQARGAKVQHVEEPAL